jgi:hypothetical protein
LLFALWGELVGLELWRLRLLDARLLPHGHLSMLLGVLALERFHRAGRRTRCGESR